MSWLKDGANLCLMGSLRVHLGLIMDSACDSVDPGLDWEHLRDGPWGQPKVLG